MQPLTQFGPLFAACVPAQNGLEIPLNPTKHRQTACCIIFTLICLLTETVLAAGDRRQANLAGLGRHQTAQWVVKVWSTSDPAWEPLA